ncbi:MAG: hypothetical protein HC924_12765 [Synechococcaceae cyanobacterium SM2_3_2]|nr:hypothetical protein [Synechococcaceae cyanobacterium SM2_3_2]
MKALFASALKLPQTYVLLAGISVGYGILIVMAGSRGLVLLGGRAGQCWHDGQLAAAD